MGFVILSKKIIREKVLSKLQGEILTCSRYNLGLRHFKGARARHVPKICLPGGARLLLETRQWYHSLPPPVLTLEGLSSVVA